MKYNFLFFPSLSFLCLPLLIAFPSLLSSFTDPQTLLSSSETHRWSARAQPPQTRRHQPTFSHRPNPFRPLFFIFGISVLCFGLCLCFGFVFRVRWICVLGIGFGVWFRRLGNWIWIWWVSAFGCGCGFVLWCAVGLLVMLCWCLGGGCAAFFLFIFYILFVIGDFVWSRLRKKIRDLGFFFFFRWWWWWWLWL